MKSSRAWTQAQLSFFLFLDFIDADGCDEPNFHLYGVVLLILHVLLQGFEGAQLEIMDIGQVWFDLQECLLVDFFFSSQHIHLKNLSMPSF
jgi:hypothetical protein